VVGRKRAGKTLPMGVANVDQLVEFYEQRIDALGNTGYFVYLLLDGRKLPRGPAAMRRVSTAQLLYATFYVGKGRRNRPWQHLDLADLFRDEMSMDPTRVSCPYCAPAPNRLHHHSRWPIYRTPGST